MSEINDAMLIELIRKHSFIYDKSEPLFKNREAKKNVWQSIGEKLNKKGGECEQRWSVLRTRYNTERRELAKPSGSAGGYKRKWPFYDALGFLDQHLIKKKTKGNIDNIEQGTEESSDTCINSILEVDDEYVQQLYIEIPSPQPENGYLQSEAELFTPVLTQSSSSFSQIAGTSSPASITELRQGNIKKKKIKSSVDENLNAAIDNVQQYFEKKKEKAEPENADMCFSKQVYYHLRDIKNDREKTAMKIQILDLFMDIMGERK